jgi:hypothetical protein
MSEEWGPWIEHDGKGCPCLGMLVEVVHEVAIGYKMGSAILIQGTRINPPKITIAGSKGGKSWDHSNWPECSRIIRYRIRRPAALQTLIQIAANPAPLPQEVEA